MASFLRIAGLIAVLSLLSKGLGLVREQVIAAFFGATGESDAFRYAYILPGFALILLGGLNGPFHSAIIAVLRRYDPVAEREERTTVIGTVAVLTLAQMAVLSAACYLFAPQLIRVFGPSLGPDTAALAAHMLQIMAPTFLLGGLIGLSFGVLNDREQYALPSLSPMLISLAIIGAVLFGSARYGPAVLAWGTLLGATAQLLLQLLPNLRAGGSWRFRLDLRHPGVAATGRLLYPAALSSSIGLVIIMIGGFYASGLPEGSFQVYNLANLVLQLPLGILLTALLIPLFPLLAGAAGRGDMVELKRKLNRGVRLVVVTSVPLVALLLVYAEPIVAVLFKYKRFDLAATLATAQVLGWLTLGLLSYALRDLLVRAFYALQDSRTPFLISLATVASSAGFGYLFVEVFRWGIGGLAAATALVTVLNHALLAWLLARRVGPWNESHNWAVGGYAMLAMGPGVAAGWWLRPWFQSRLDSPVTLVAGLALCLSVSAVVYVAGLYLLGLTEVREVLAGVRRRLLPRGRDGQTQGGSLRGPVDHEP